MLNGCLCCVMTGKMRDAIVEIQQKYSPDRILIETSGSAFPAAISIQLRDLARELSSTDGCGPGIRLDGIVNVIDVENFAGYADTSKSAALQAQYTDLLVFNKWEHVDERQFDLVWDRVNDLNTDTPKLKSDRGAIPWQAIMGLDSKLGLGLVREDKHSHNGHSHENDGEHMSEIETLTVRISKGDGTELDKFIEYLDKAPKDEIYRMKFILRTISSKLPDSTSSNDSIKTFILNWAFGRYEFTEVSEERAPLLLEESLAGLGTVMVGRGDGRMFKKRLSSGILGQSASVEMS